MSIVLGIEEIIKQHLPEALGEELKKVLNDYEKLKEKNRDLQTKFDKADFELSSYRHKVSDLETKNYNLRKELEKHEELQKRENKLEVTLLQNELKCQKEKYESVVKLTETVFKNPTVKRTVFENENKQVPYIDQFGNSMSHYVNDSSNKTEETTTD